MNNSIRIIEAINYATIAHEGQIRKTNGMPKIIHPFGVALILSQHGYSEDLVIAGLLHDVIEDCKDYSSDDITSKFGTIVSTYVNDVSEPDKSLDWKTRKLNHIEHIKNACFESKVLCAADKIHNLYSLEQDMKIQGDKIWNSFNAPKDEIKWYYASMYKAIIYGYVDQEIPIFKLLHEIVVRVIGEEKVMDKKPLLV